MKNGQFLNWIADRLVHVYKENPNTDFVSRLRKIAAEVGYRPFCGHCGAADNSPHAQGCLSRHCEMTEAETIRETAGRC